MSFDPNPRPLEKSDNGWVYCYACERPQLVAGHECATSRHAPSEWAQALTERIASQRAQLDAIREALDEWAPVGDETLVDAVIRLRHAYEAKAVR